MNQVLQLSENTGSYIQINCPKNQN